MAAALADGVLNTRNLRRVTCGREPDPGDPRPALLASAGGAAIAEGRRKGLGRRSWDGGLTNLWPLSPGGTKEGGAVDDADGGDATNKSRARRAAAAAGGAAPPRWRALWLWLLQLWRSCSFGLCCCCAEKSAEF